MGDITYTVKKNRMMQGVCRGFDLVDDGLILRREEGKHELFLLPLDGIDEDALWGRLHVPMELEEDVLCYIYVFASNEETLYEGMGQEESHRERMIHAGAKRFVNRSDILLYEWKGRFLYLGVEVIGEGDAVLSNIRIERSEEDFLNFFPEIYRERNSFFHRYMGIYQTVYNHFQLKIEEAENMLDPDTCPKELLPMYAGWLGIEMGEDFAEEPWLRDFVKEAYTLNRMKGTKRCIERVCELVLGKPVIVLEGNVMKEYVEEKDLSDFRKLYGKSPFDVTVLVDGEKTEKEKANLSYLLDRYKPIRSRLNIIYLKQEGILDQYCYLDRNANVLQTGMGFTDEDQAMDAFASLE